MSLASPPVPQAAWLEARGLVKHFESRRGWIRRSLVVTRAVDGVSLAIPRGESIGIVGESGSGKTTLARLLVGLLRPSAGEVRFDGASLAALPETGAHAFRRRVQLVFQDPYGALNPRKTVGQSLGRALRLRPELDARGRDCAIRQVLEEVGLTPPWAFVDRYPHELSGGQRQRVVIGRAIAPEPEVLVADEPVSALDVSVRAQVLNLLNALRARRRLTFVLISHDLGVVRRMCERVAVMYLGRIIEMGPTAEVLAEPMHPYTHALRASIPTMEPPDSRAPDAEPLRGEIPSATAPPRGCHFHPRCPRVGEGCDAVYPPLEERGTGHRVACHYPLHVT